MQVVSAIRKKVINRLFVGLGLVQATLAHELRRPTRLGSPAGRLGAPRWCRDLGGAENTQGPLLCIFIAYSSDVSLSITAYLQALRDAGFEIIVINNKSTSVPLLQELSSICWRVYDRVNIGRDLGAYKDGIMLLSDEGFLRDCQALCIANDSVQFVPGDHGAAFTRSIIEFLKCPAKALFSHDSHQITRHYQSFFQIFKNEIVNSHAFRRFWSQYRPLSHRGHCIRNGEVKASTLIYNEITTARVLYTTDSLLGVLASLMAKHQLAADQILSLMPSITHTMQREDRTYALDQLVVAAKNQEMLTELDHHCLAELIESSNPSHVAAFLYPKFLNCPLIKKDLCLAGSFSIGKALQLFREALIQAGVESQELAARVDEFRVTILSKGVPADFRGSPIQRAVKGVPEGFTYAGP